MTYVLINPKIDNLTLQIRSGQVASPWQTAPAPVFCIWMLAAMIRQ